MSYVKISEIGAERLERINKILQGIPGGAIKAAHSALKRAGESAKTQAGRFAAAEYTISKSEFMRNVDSKQRIEASGGGVLSLSVSYAGEVISLLRFHTRFTSDEHLSTQVMRGGTPTALQHVFKANFDGAQGAYERIGKARFPVEQKYGPSTAHMMQNEDVIEQMDKTMSETFEKRLDHEVSRLLNGYGG